MDESTRKKQSNEHGTSIERPGIRVFCLCSEATFRGLKWSFDQQFYSDRRYELEHGSLSDLEGRASDFDLFLLCLDLGQPVPVESLRRQVGVPGLCATVQPTPAQLLSIGELFNWGSCAWDGSAYDFLARRLDQWAGEFEKNMNRDWILESLKSWLQVSYADIAFLNIESEIENYKGAEKFYLEPEWQTISFGALASEAFYKLPIEGRELYFEIIRKDGFWSFRRLNEDIDLPYETGHRVSESDMWEHRGVRFAFRRCPSAERLFGLMSGIFDPNQLKTSKPRDLSDLIRQYISSHLTGALRIQSGHKNASIYFTDGLLRQAHCGAILGQKALLRILSWPEISWHFDRFKRSPFGNSIELDFKAFNRIHESWLRSWKRVSALQPPADLVLTIPPENFVEEQHFSSPEFEVLARVSEHGKTQDVLNNTPLLDVDVIEALVSLRKRGLIVPQKRKQAQ